jgi:hypothetical protein
MFKLAFVVVFSNLIAVSLLSVIIPLYPTSMLFFNSVASLIAFSLALIVFM